MPIFDYRCGHCNKVSELMVKRHDAAPPCPSCGGEMVKEVAVFYPRHTERVYRIRDPRVVVKRKPNE